MQTYQILNCLHNFSISSAYFFVTNVEDWQILHVFIFNTNEYITIKQSVRAQLFTSVLFVFKL